jgi:hypothetical protein
MDGWDIADALLGGSDIPTAKLRTIAKWGDHADALYVLLFEVISGRKALTDVRSAVRDTCPEELVEGWVNVISYSAIPTRRSLARLVKAIHEPGPLSGLIMRLSPLTLVGSHRRCFAEIAERAANKNPFLKAEIDDVLAALRTRVGPARLIAKRDRSGRRSKGHVR